MSIETINEEIQLTNRMLSILEADAWNYPNRVLIYHQGNHDFEIKQEAHVQGLTGEHILAKTMFYRDCKSHKFDGPAYIWHGTRNPPSIEMYYVNGKKFTEVEFNFFIKGIVAA